jgi:hypothetical protein
MNDDNDQEDYAYWTGMIAACLMSIALLAYALFL